MDIGETNQFWIKTIKITEDILLGIGNINIKMVH